MENFTSENAIAAIRVSSAGQGIDGDSPEAQKEQIAAYANVIILPLKNFLFLWTLLLKKSNQCKRQLTTVEILKMIFNFLLLNPLTVKGNHQNILVKKGVRNPNFPYKRIGMCPHCEKPLFGSASKGRLGEYYPAYHCNKRGHYFRVPKGDFDKTIERFIKNINLAPGYEEALTNAVIEEWNKRQKEIHKDEITFDTKITELKTQIKMTVDKIKLLTSEVAIKYMEQDIVKMEEQMVEYLSEKEKAETTKPTDMKIVMAYIQYFLEHFEFLLLNQPNPMNKAGHFGVLFDVAPTYQEINSGTPKLAQFVKLNEAFYFGQDKLVAGLRFGRR